MVCHGRAAAAAAANVLLIVPSVAAAAAPISGSIQHPATRHCRMAYLSAHRRRTFSPSSSLFSPLAQLVRLCVTQYVARVVSAKL